MKVKLSILFSLFFYAFYLRADATESRLLERPTGTATVNEKCYDKVNTKEAKAKNLSSKNELENGQQKQEARRNNLDPALYDVNVPTWR